MPADDSRKRRMARAAQNQSLCREVNARISDLSESFNNELAQRGFICECDDPHCTQEVPMTVAEYEQVRDDGAAFLVAPDPAHVSPDVEEIVTRHDRYWVVKKIGVAGEVARRYDSHQTPHASS